MNPSDDGPETDCGSAAAYVLGALPSQERLAFESHLAGCEGCRLAVSELAGIPGLLARVSPDDLTGDVAGPVPDTLLPRLLREVRRRRRTRWVAAVGVAAAAVAAVVVVVVGVVIAHPGQDAPASVAMTRLVSAPITATVALEPEGQLTRIDMRCRYAGGTYGDLPAYRLVVTGVDGSTHEVAWWDVGPDGTTRVIGSVDLRRSQIASVEVRTQAGRPVLRLLG